MLAKDPTDSNDAADPIEPIDNTDPIDPTLRDEFFEYTDSIESIDR